MAKPTSKRRSRLDKLLELAAQYVLGDVDIYHAIDLYAQMCRDYGDRETDQAIRQLREVKQMMGG